MYLQFLYREDTGMTAATGFVVPTGGGKHFASPTPGRSFAMKLLGRETIPHAWKNTGSETGRVLFLYAPAAAGGLIEALAERPPADADEHKNSSSATVGRSSGQTRFERPYFAPDFCNC